MPHYLHQTYKGKFVKMFALSNRENCLGMFLACNWFVVCVHVLMCQQSCLSSLFTVDYVIQPVTNLLL